MKDYHLNERYLNKFKYSYSANSYSECWEWHQSVDHDNYGVFYANGTSYKAHRMAAYLYRDDWNPDLDVCHHCDNPRCVNPSHLFMGTNADNVADRHRKGRSRNRQEPGEAHHMSKLVEREVLAIREDSRPYREIAKEYKVSPSLVSMIKLKKRWAHL